ncbi:MAG: hypothetical protein AB1588_21060 [Pseudomonadota bacterium]
MNKLTKSHGHGLLNYFDIVEDGLYTIQTRATEGSIKSASNSLKISKTLPLIKDWVSKRSFKATCPWPEESDGPHRPEMCYCKEIYPCSNGDYILVLWKNDPSDSEGYRGLILDENGAPSTYLNNTSGDTGDNVVWGHPCYYWIIPERNLVVSIKFPDSKCDNALFKKWIKSVVRNKLKIPGYNSRSVTDSAVRIRFSTPQQPEDYSYLYRFETAIREFDTSIEYLESIAADTKSITVRDYVSTFAPIEAQSSNSSFLDATNVDVLETITKIIDLFRKTESNSSQDSSISKRKVELMIEGTPSLEIVNELINFNEQTPSDDWSDVIFTTNDDNNVSFKSHRLVERLVMNRFGDPYSGGELFQALSAAREELLSRFVKADMSSTALLNASSDA